MKKRTPVEEVLERAATLPTKREQHEYLIEAVEEDKRYVEGQFNDPDSLLLKLNEVNRKEGLEWFSLPDTLIPATADRGSGTGGSGYSEPVSRASHRSPSTAKGYERPDWGEVEKRVTFIGSLDGKIECLENFLACDKEHIDESLFAWMEAEQEEPGHVPFRVKLRLGLAYLRACGKEGIPPLLKVSTIVRNPHDALLPSSTSEEVRAASIALAEKVRNRVYRGVAREALQEVRRKHEKRQSKSGWRHDLDRLRKKASDIFCGEEFLELSEKDYGRHDKRPSSTGPGSTQSRQAPTEEDKRIKKIEQEAATVFEGKSRTPGRGAANIHSDVREWAVQSFHTYLEECGSEEAKDKVIDIAERHNYHFSRRWLEQELKKQYGS